MTLTLILAVSVSVTMHVTLALTVTVDAVGAAEAEAASRAQWRGMRSLAALCLAYGPGVSDPPPASPPSPTLDRQLQWLIGDDHSEVCQQQCHCLQAPISVVIALGTYMFEVDILTP